MSSEAERAPPTSACSVPSDMAELHHLTGFSKAAARPAFSRLQLHYRAGCMMSCTQRFQTARRLFKTVMRSHSHVATVGKDAEFLNEYTLIDVRQKGSPGTTGLHFPRLARTVKSFPGKNRVKFFDQGEGGRREGRSLDRVRLTKETHTPSINEGCEACSRSRKPWINLKSNEVSLVLLMCQNDPFIAGLFPGMHYTTGPCKKRSASIVY